MAGEEGFEPSHAGIKIRCLNQLGDSPTQPFVCRPEFVAILTSNRHQTKFFYDFNKSAIGWRLSAFAFHDVQRSGICCITLSAADSSAKAQKTQAPDPVIFAFPNCDSHLIASSTAGNSAQATVCKSFFQNISAVLEKSAILTGFVSLVNSFAEKIAGVGT